jgi:hypothetical protein
MVAVRSARKARIDTATDTMDMDQEQLPEIVVTVSPASWADLLRHIMGSALDNQHGGDDASC